MKLFHIERTLQLLVASMAVLGTYFLCRGQEGSVLPLLILAVAVTSVVVTDFKRWFEMGPTLSSIVALAAAGTAAWQMRSPWGASPFIAMANLLAYLQIVLLFQRKTPRVYWQLLMLSLLQVVVSTALNEGLSFGLMTIAFMFFFILAMLLLLVVAETDRCLEVENAPVSWVEASLLPRKQRRTSSFAQFSGQRTPGSLWSVFGRRLIGHAITATLVSLLVASAVFFLVPRKNQGTKLSSSFMSLERLIGFSQSVELGQPGQLHSNSEIVMRVKLTEDRTNEPYRVLDEPLFRGAVLSRYLDRHWLPANTGGELPRIFAREEVVRQQITIEPLGLAVVPAVYPAIPVGRDVGLQFNTVGRHWQRRTAFVSQQIALELRTTGFRNGQLRSVTPCFSNVDRAELTQLPRARLPRLVATAQKIVEAANLSDDDRRGKARELERYFLDPANEYRYSLTSPVRDPSLDPNEDFVNEHRVGHCEYFASALVMMLRSQNIPTRMIVGFRSDEFNAADNFWTVRQEHAHAWVEVYLEPNQILPHEMSRTARQHGGWLRLDPTPGGTSDPNFDAYGSWWADVRSSVDYLQLLWSAYVDRLDTETQQEAIYQPIVSRTKSLRDMLLNSALADHLRRLAKSLGLGNGRWFSWRAAGASMVLALLLVGLFQLARIVWRRCKGWRHGHDTPSAQRLPVATEFYRRLEEILDRYGYHRRSGQTQREMAAAAAREFAATEPLRAIATLPQEIVDAYYLVRFGERSLNAEQVVHIQHTLEELEADLAEGRVTVIPHA